MQHWGEVFLEFKNFLTCEFINVGIGGFFQTCKDMMENKIVDSNVNLSFLILFSIKITQQFYVFKHIIMF